MVPVSRRAFLRTSLLSGAGLMALGTAGCGSSGTKSVASSTGASASGAASGAGPLAKIAMQASWVNDAEFMGYFIAATNGLYTKQNLEFTYKPGGSSVIPESILLAKRADISLTSPDTTVKAIVEDEAPFVIIGTQYQKSPVGIVSLAKNNIHEPKDLIGKTLAVPDANRLGVEAMFKLNSVDMSKVKIVPYAFDPTPLLKGDVDATLDFVTDVPFAIKKQGGEPTSFLLYDFGFKLPSDTIVVTKDTLAEKREAVVAWMRASRAGWQENFTDVTKYPAQFQASWFKDNGISVDNANFFNTAQQPLIEAPGGIFSMSEQVISDAVSSLQAVGIKATPKCFDTSLLAEL